MEFLSRILGMVVFMLIGARVGALIAPDLGIDPQATSFIFALVGILFGLVMTPIFTVRPIQRFNREVRETPIEMLITALAGAFIGALFGLLLMYPISTLRDVASLEPLSPFLPLMVIVMTTYLGFSIFSFRSREIWTILGSGMVGQRRPMGGGSNRQLLLDTSVLIDGRIVEIAKTGFLGGTLLIPRFVLNELHQVADSSDPLRRNRGRRGLTKLNELQRNNVAPVKVIEEDVEEISEVDGKLVALSLQLDAPLLTNDYNLNRVAEAQGVLVLNINSLANSVRSVYIPGESFPLHVIQEGKEYGQGVGYLEDGTMVVVENGRVYMDRTIRVTVTKLITRDTGRMIFAVPDNNGAGANLIRREPVN
jgi:uncharacterized protein YacL